MTIINEWMEHPETMGAEALQALPELMVQYPYCATYRLLYTIALANTHSIRLPEELRRTALMMPDCERLFELVNNGEYEWINLMLELQRKQKEQGQQVSDDFVLIDQFLEASTTSAPLPTDAHTYSLDDIEAIDDESDQPADEADDTLSIIDQFLEADHEGLLFSPKAEQTPSENEPEELPNVRENAFLTESLAKLYVKQHKFEQALAIFSSLNLQYPKKSSYFADQIRYLQKVIDIQNNKNN